VRPLSAYEREPRQCGARNPGAGDERSPCAAPLDEELDARDP
jgi:hypothetical protein